jgi:hypothetical protein
MKTIRIDAIQPTYGQHSSSSLECEYLTHPLGIDVVHPRLGWILQAGVMRNRPNPIHVHGCRIE